MNILKTRMMQAANPSLVEGLSRFFKSDLERLRELLFFDTERLTD